MHMGVVHMPDFQAVICYVPLVIATSPIMYAVSVRARPAHWTRVPHRKCGCRLMLQVEYHQNNS